MKPDLEAAKAAFADFCRTVAALRDPKDGCPWDLEQTHETLRRYMIEEAYEAADAMAHGDPAEIRDELGDVLLQVVLNSQVALDGKAFSIVDVIRGIDAKMRRRHPHVFGDETGQKITSKEVRSNWEVIKAGEKAAAKPASLMADAVKKTPATLQALKIGKIAAKVRFDWDTPAEVFAQVRSEVDELAKELADPKTPKERIADELGDVFFSLAQLSRHLGLDPEVVATDGNRKFLRRFAALEALAAKDGTNVETATRDQLEDLWKRVKKAETTQG